MSLFYTLFKPLCGLIVLTEDSTETLFASHHCQTVFSKVTLMMLTKNLYCVTHIASTLDIQYHRNLTKCWICDNFIFFFAWASKNVYFIMKNVFLSPSRLWLTEKTFSGYPFALMLVSWTCLRIIHASSCFPFCRGNSNTKAEGLLAFISNVIMLYLEMKIRASFYSLRHLLESCDLHLN